MLDITTITDALLAAQQRGELPTTLDTAGLREIAADVRARSVFSARMSNLTVVDALKKMVDELAAGEINLATARVTILEALREVGYTPEGGFPQASLAATPGQADIPTAVAGSLQDLSSRRRMDFMLRTQLALVRGRGQQVRGMAAARMKQFPAYELIRSRSVTAPRMWGGRHEGTPPVRGGGIDPRPRWIIAGGQPTADGRLIALKGDPIWGELGSSGNFDDALDVDYPPFAFNSGMRWREVSRGECNALRITGPNGESIDAWLAMDHPLLVNTQSGIPVPQGSVKKMDPALREAFEKDAGIEIVEDTATTRGNGDAVRERIAERRAARAAAREKDLARAIEKGGAR
jgi:hypothetical protein